MTIRRVELRTAELQIRDIENASLDLFALIMVRIIQRYNLNFYIPMSKVYPLSTLLI